MKPIQKKIKNPIAKYNDFLSNDQKNGKDIINKNTISIIKGKAGSGKTHLAAISALEMQAIGKKNGGITKIIITRPTIFRKEDNIGFLPGDADAKYYNWIRPVLDVANEIDGAVITEKKLKDKIIEVMPLMFIQGMTFANSCVIVDEAENCTREQIVGIFTRLGKNSKLIFCGDFAQCLLPNKSMSGFPRLLELEGRVKNLASVELSTNWRNEIIEELLEKYLYTDIAICL